MKKLITGLAGLLFLLALSSCEKNIVFDQFYHVEDVGWHWNDTAQFSFDLEDTSAVYDILIQVRHTTEYPMSNLYMFVDIAGPSGQSIKDTIQYILAEPDGKWVGKGVGSIRELAYLYKRNTMFPEPGMYTISIEQAMRVSELPVRDIGVRIETANP
jgi:gliding motility-associated lipoprotein GldH